MDLLKIASVPAATVSPTATVVDAVNLMNDHRVGAVAVTNDNTLVGIFTERDLMIRVVLEGKDPKTTQAGDVMTPNCVVFGSLPSPKRRIKRPKTFASNVSALPKSSVCSSLSFASTTEIDQRVASSMKPPSSRPS